MILYVNIDDRARIVSVADEGFHLGPDEQAANFADELVQDGHVVIYDSRMIPLYNLIDGEAVARTQEEIDADFVEPEEPTPTDYEARISALEKQLAAYEAAYVEGVQNA